MAVPRYHSAAMSFALERKVHLIGTFLTNDPARFSFGNLSEEVNSSRGFPTTLKLNHKRLGWGEKSAFESMSSTDARQVPYRSVELDFVGQMFVESRYSNVLLCVIRIPKQTKFKYEIVAFRLKNDHDVRIILDLFAALTQIPFAEGAGKTRDQAQAGSRTITFDRSGLHPTPPSTPGTRGRNAPGMSPRVHGSSGFPGSSVRTASSSSAWPRPIPDDSGSHEERLRTRKNYDVVDSRVYSDQSRSVVFSDGEPSGTPTMNRRSAVNRKPSRTSYLNGNGNGNLTNKSVSSPAIPKASYSSSRGIVSGDSFVAQVPLNDESEHEFDSAGEVTVSGRKHLERRTTLVDNGIVKVTVEEYQDPTETKDPDIDCNDHESNPYSISHKTTRFPNDSSAFYPDSTPYSTAAKHSHRSRKLDHVHRTSTHGDTSDTIPSSAMTSSVQKVFSRPAKVQRSLSESGSNVLHRRIHRNERERYSEIPISDSGVVFRPNPVQDQHTMVDNIYQSRSSDIRKQPMGTRPESIYQSRSSVIRNQPMRTRPESIYQSRASTIRRQPMNRAQEDVYQLRSSTLRSQPISVVVPDPPDFQSRQVMAGQFPGNPERRTMGNSTVHRESRNGYEWWDGNPVQHIPHSKRGSVYHQEKRTSRR